MFQRSSGIVMEKKSWNMFLRKLRDCSENILNEVELMEFRYDLNLRGGIEVLIEKYGGSILGDTEPRVRVSSLPTPLG